MTPRGRKVSRHRSPKPKRVPVRNTTSVLDLVRAGVERFVLKDATMMSFQKTIRAAAKKGKNSAHPLSGAAFRQIVKEAIRERKRRIGRALREYPESDEEVSE
jgi:DNA-binding NarL/FixJ family response regulator